MSDLPARPKEGPSMEDSVQEVQGSFPTDAALQEALGQLALAGYDRSDFSLPEENAGSTPNEGAENPVDDIDKAQVRTLGSSMAGYAGAAAVAGATLATGGAAGVAVAAAAAVGIGSGAAANAAGRAAANASADDRDARGAAGTLVLAVRTRSPDEVSEATTILQQAGATDVRPVSRAADMRTKGVSAASWTGD